jgi:hypothetical protein
MYANKLIGMGIYIKAVLNQFIMID